MLISFEQQLSIPPGKGPILKSFDVEMIYLPRRESASHGKLNSFDINVSRIKCAERFNSWNYKE